MTAYSFLLKQIEHDGWALRPLNADASFSVDLARTFLVQLPSGTPKLNAAVLVAQLTTRLLQAERRAA